MDDAVATVHGIGHNGANTRLILYKFSLTSVGTSATGAEQKLSGMATKGTIKQIRAYSSSDDFDISIRNKTGVSAGTINEILAIEGIDNRYDTYGLDINYRNADAAIEGSLYAVVKNDDSSHATGTIYLELYVEVLDTI
ncbi:MAG: hypothetical protein A4E60_00241 [Syntrophorhabdus sp. PtaB.Bin047]|jgi:hypothetical protein|nr:MAG: hypothetical protein A4E60_00241 [Syntrophorhabdus sp. PtaB.Bin047]